ncbi:Putative secreted amidase SCO6344 [hydrothermal vent metagenome]|uniref:Secreted amidase SCO6344 n=1 Tax=hydrothermal vent metagenome TaxID=652676 RepID=A0A3B0T7W6_9ZZZZ
MKKIDLENETIASLGKKMANGEINARGLTKHCLARIAQLDTRVNAVIELNPDALEIAAKLDDELAAGICRGPLHGLPVMVKDNLDTGDKMMTSAGSLAMDGAHATSDAFVVKRLREAGAVILGKTNLSEWANFRSSRSTSGWSSRGGQTRNPYALDRTPGGSSSGSAAAVASGFSVAAIGTETDGSIVSPSAMNSIVGIKPTVGLVSRSGIIPISHSQDTAGAMARSVEDAAILLGAICGPDDEDAASMNSLAHCAELKNLALKSNALNGARIGVARNYCGFHEGVDAVIAQVITDLESCGATIVDSLELTPTGDIRPSENRVLSTEFKAGLNNYLAQRSPKSAVSSLSDIINFNLENAENVMTWFQQELLEISQETNGLGDEKYLEALKTSKSLSAEMGIDHLLKANNLDAIIAPTTCTPWLIDWVNGDNRSGGSAATAAVAGYPSVTVPAGYVHGLPVGVSFFTKAWQEVRLLNLAYAYEQYSKRRVSPQFKDTIGYDKQNGQ